MAALDDERQKMRADEDALWGAYAADRSPENRKALAQFHWPLCYSVSLKFIKQHSVGKRYRHHEGEIVSEAAVILMKCIEGFRPGLGYRFSTYYCNSFFRTILPTIARKFRHGSSHASSGIPADELACKMRSPERFEESIGVSVQEAMDQSGIGERDQEIVELRFVAGMTFDEIAALHGITKERARQVIDLSLSKIRQQFGLPVNVKSKRYCR